jgi:negative regulator of sigma E activity
MQNGLLIKRNEEILQQSNQMDLNVYDDLQEINKQLQILNEQLLEDKEKAEEQKIGLMYYYFISCLYEYKQFIISSRFGRTFLFIYNPLSEILATKIFS